MKSPPYFADRKEAFLALYEKLTNTHPNSNQALILATSTQSLALANMLANELDARLDVLLSAPILAPNNAECAIAMVNETMELILYEELINAFAITLDYVYGEAKRVYDEILLPSIYKYRKGAPLSPLANKHIFLIDDGIEIGASMELAIQTCIHKHAQRIYVLSPIIAHDAIPMLERASDVLIAVYTPIHALPTAHYYTSLPTLSDDDILHIINPYTKDSNAAH